MSPDTLREICIRTARAGNTTAVVDAARITGATVVCHDYPEAERVRRLGVATVSVRGGVMRFVGTRGPYLVDLPVLAVAASGWDRAESRARSAEERATRAEQRVLALEAALGRERCARAMLSAELAALEARVSAAETRTDGES